LASLQRSYSEDSSIYKSLKTLFEKLKEDIPYNKLPKQKVHFIRMEGLNIEIYL